MAEARLMWTETEPPVRVESGDELFAHLQRRGIIGENEFGRIVTLETQDSAVTLGIAPDGGFVQIASRSGEPPYYVTLGNPGAVGHRPFHLHGVHRTEIPGRFLLPLVVTREVVREFLDTGVRSTSVSWEEI